MLRAVQHTLMVFFPPIQAEWGLALGLNALLIAIAQRLPLLTPSGWVHAGALGTILWGCLGWRGWLAVVIYLALGSLVTRLGFLRKQAAGLAEARGGRRGPENVWGSAATGALIAMLIKAGIGDSSLLILGFSASFAAKLADTFGSEIGKRWGRTTVLITNLRSVPAGTDGAISLEGTLASAAGSVLMTVVFVGLFTQPPTRLAWGEPALLVASIGLLATLLESLMGALVQHRVRWLTNELVNGLQTFVAAFLAIAFAACLGWGSV
ncbi:MAG: DUF92 domain-containing protein [Prochlorococcus sp.]|nr:DUF92 domain-containing protein [Prochlorococcus sp.]CAI8158153.1 MAG: Uncharacterised protein [Prochlorococcus marinus str. MIT 9215]